MSKDYPNEFPGGGKVRVSDEMINQAFQVVLNQSGEELFQSDLHSIIIKTREQVRQISGGVISTEDVVRAIQFKK